MRQMQVHAPDAPTADWAVLAEVEGCLDWYLVRCAGIPTLHFLAAALELPPGTQLDFTRASALPANVPLRRIAA